MCAAVLSVNVCSSVHVYVYVNVCACLLTCGKARLTRGAWRAKRVDM